RCFKAQAKGQNLRTVHVLPPVHVEVISWPSSRDEFHTQRRRAYYRKIEGKGNMKMVDIDASPEDICREILSAEHVFSSSLHGIVFSHALERPVTFVQPIHESLLKFKDYYSSIGIDLPKPLEGFEGKFMSGVGLSPVTLNYMEEDFLMPGPEYLKSAGVMVR
ncbi:polysaccharide pyruvyl transferase family protein, partial [Modicisalibacter zincidurans]